MIYMTIKKNSFFDNDILNVDFSIIVQILFFYSSYTFGGTMSQILKI